jgi:hypothetical protein
MDFLSIFNQRVHGLGAFIFVFHSLFEEVVLFGLKKLRAQLRVG